MYNKQKHFSTLFVWNTVALPGAHRAGEAGKGACDFKFKHGCRLLILLTSNMERQQRPHAYM